MAVQLSLDFARKGFYGGKPISAAALKEKRDKIRKRAAALQRVSRTPDESDDEQVSTSNGQLDLWNEQV